MNLDINLRTCLSISGLGLLLDLLPTDLWDWYWPVHTGKESLQVPALHLRVWGPTRTLPLEQENLPTVNSPDLSASPQPCEIWGSSHSPNVRDLRVNILQYLYVGISKSTCYNQHQHVRINMLQLTSCNIYLSLMGLMRQIRVWIISDTDNLQSSFFWQNFYLFT